MADEVPSLFPPDDAGSDRVHVLSELRRSPAVPTGRPDADQATAARLEASRETYRLVLRFELTRPGPIPAKVRWIRRELGISAIRYSQLLNRAIDDEAMTAEFPVLVSDLRATRDRRRLTRSPKQDAR